MNMKSIFACLIVLNLPFNVSAAASQEEPKIIANEQIALNQGNSTDTHLVAHIVNSQTIPQASSEKNNEFITELSVYLLIIIVYSIYGFKANSKNAEN